MNSAPELQVDASASLDESDCRRADDVAAPQRPELGARDRVGGDQVGQGRQRDLLRRRTHVEDGGTQLCEDDDEDDAVAARKKRTCPHVFVFFN